jgi:hypothetical protein
VRHLHWRGGYRCPDTVGVEVRNPSRLLRIPTDSASFSSDANRWTGFLHAGAPLVLVLDHDVLRNDVVVDACIARCRATGELADRDLRPPLRREEGRAKLSAR